VVIKRVVLAGSAAVAVVAVVITLLVTAARPSHALAPWDSKTTTSAGICKVGDLHYFGLAGFTVLGEHPVHVTKVEVLGVPRGLTVQSVQAVSSKETRLAPLGADSQEHWMTSAYAKVPVHPVTDAVLAPHDVSVNWWFLITLRIDSLGKHMTDAVKVSYTAGGDHGSTTYVSQFGSDCKADH
jgi:hypothetical protein